MWAKPALRSALMTFMMNYRTLVTSSLGTDIMQLQYVCQTASTMIKLAVIELSKLLCLVLKLSKTLIFNCKLGEHFILAIEKI